ncbi:Major Facilitator Superfamily [Nesidiocoris tenuis]|uniref:Major Facilitator Superfamily n=1 Tax=Nesidiocoris tenuis TaxID=355587 RepID=A0ABN7BHY1_9HEMI|nr:Major Facilitator Superfamily [Nesidiocoris tenuis]
MPNTYGATEDSSEVPEEFQGSVKDMLNFDTKLYKKRWLILILFVSLELLTGFQWVELSIVEDVLSLYYNVPPALIEWTSTVFSFSCIFFCLPASWLIERYGLRGTLLLCATLNAIGSLLKAYAIGKGDFALQFVGQTSVGICQALVIAAPPRIASVWFGPSEVSTASSIGVLGFQAGAALGFLIPPFVIRGSDDAETEQGLAIINFSLGGLSLFVLLTMIIWFQNQPPAPPSKAALRQRDFQRSTTFLGALKVLSQTKGYFILLVACGINFATYCALAALLNAFILTYYPNAQRDAGCIGLTMSIAGMCGLLVSGRILDKTKLFKEVYVVTYASAVLSTVAISFYLDSGSILIQYFTIGSLGFFATALFTVGFEMATELSYPTPEGTTNGIVSGFSQLLSVIITTTAATVLPYVGARWCLFGFASLYGVGSFLSCFIPKNYKRQEANAVPSLDNTIRLK